MVWDMIITGLGDIIGYEVIIVLLFIFTFILMLVSRGAGITSMIGTIFLSAYLFGTEKISGRYLLANEWFITIVILLGLFMGFIIYQLFINE